MFIKTFIAVLFLAAAGNAITAYAQHNTVSEHRTLDSIDLDKQIRESKQLQAQMDSSFNAQLQKLKTESEKGDSVNIQRGLDAFVQMQKERDDKLKRDLWIKGSVFGCMLVLTIVGFVRRKRQKKQG